MSHDKSITGPHLASIDIQTEPTCTLIDIKYKIEYLNIIKELKKSLTSILPPLF